MLTELGPKLVPAIYDTGESFDQAFCVMERLRGRTLAELLEQSLGPLTLAAFRPLALGFLALLEAIHRRGWDMATSSRKTSS